MSRRRPGEIRQLQIDWNGVQSTPPVDPLAELPKEPFDSAPPAPPVEENHRPMLRLRWDFRTRFPQVRPDLVDAGVISAEDNLPQSIAAIHREHGGKMLGALSDLDAAMEERRRGPAYVSRPESDSLSEPTRLQRWYESLLGVYEEWFGTEAAEAFDRAVRAWHAHIEVVVDRDGVATARAAEPQESLPSTMDEEVAASPVRPATPRLQASPEKRVIARLPLPKPLPDAVAAGHFGVDEEGQPIHPCDDEVHAITRDHAEMLIDLIQSLPDDASSPAVEAEIQAGIAKYAEDFGEPAAQRLEAYCWRQADPEGKSWRNVISGCNADGPEANR